MPYIVNESRALKKKLSGIKVEDANAPIGGREVQVHFIEPDYTFTDASFPGIYLRYGSMIRAIGREHRGPVLLPYAPEGFSGDVQVPVDIEDKTNTATEPWLTNEASKGDPHASPYWVPDVPVPFDLGFDINVLTRSYQHSFQIHRVLSGIQFLPERFGYLEIPEDGTVRTLELAGGPEFRPLKDTSGKPYVETLYSVKVASELNLYDVKQINRAATVAVSVLKKP